MMIEGRGNMRGDPPSEAAARVSDLVRRIVMAGDRYTDVAAARARVHRTHLDALAALMQADQDGAELTPGRLGRSLGLSSAATTALIDRLEVAGHAERRRSERDRRSVTVHMTPLALDDGATLFMPLWRALVASLEPFSEDELIAAERVMTALLGATRYATRDASL